LLQWFPDGAVFYGLDWSPAGKFTERGFDFIDPPGQKCIRRVKNKYKIYANVQ